jgi:hypothetical protein
LFGSDGTITTGASSSTAGRGSTGGGTRSSTGASSSGGRVGVGGSLGLGGDFVAGGSGPIPQGGAVSFGGTVSIGGTVSVGGIGVAGFGTAGAGGGVAVTPITCGDQTCNANTQSCCVGLAGLNCIGKNQDCGGAVLGCTVNSDCAGNGVCCISITGDVADASSCKARCDNMGTGRDRQLCQTADECAPPFRFCTATIFGVNICTRRP